MKIEEKAVIIGLAVVPDPFVATRLLHGKPAPPLLQRARSFFVSDNKVFIKRKIKQNAAICCESPTDACPLQRGHAAEFQLPHPPRCKIGMHPCTTLCGS